MGGEFTQWNSIEANKLVRLNANGTSDATFSSGSGFNNTVNSVAVQSNGKIIVAGNFTTYQGVTHNRIVRLNADGSADASFAIGTGANSNIFVTAIQPDGKILIAGEFSSVNGTSRSKIARLNTDGTVDAAFTSAGVNAIIYSMAVQTDGKIVIGGTFTTVTGQSKNRIARLNADGTLDAAFNNGTGADATVRAISLQPDGKMVIGGNFTLYNGTTSNYITRLNSDGSIDPAFASGNGFNYNGVVYSILWQFDGKFLVGGNFSSYNEASVKRMLRLNADGTNDATFAISGSGPTATVFTINLQSNGRILAGGAFNTFNGFARNHLASLNSNGTVDTEFYPFTVNGYSSSHRVGKITLQPDGRILIAGSFTTYNGLSAPYIARLNADGTLDPSFNAGTGPNGFVNKFWVLPDGKILIVGPFLSYNGVMAKGIARLNANGSLDTTFNQGGSGASGQINTLVVQGDGKIVIGGDFYQFNGTPKQMLARLNPNGTLDNTFISETNTGGSIWTIQNLPDGKLFIGGNFAQYGSPNIFTVARLFSNGAVDLTFNTGGSGAEYDIGVSALQDDGKILVGGNFNAFNGVTVRNIVRLNTDGTLDATFNPTTLGVGIVNDIAVQDDGKIILGGSMNPYNGFTGRHIMRLNPDGTLDNSFIQGTGFDSPVLAVTLQTDGKVLVGGNFNNYNGSPKKFIARLNGTNTLATAEFSSAATLNIFPNPAEDQISFKLPVDANIIGFEIFDIMGKRVDSNKLIENSLDVRHYGAGLYIVRIETDRGNFSAKFIKR